MWNTKDQQTYEQSKSQYCIEMQYVEEQYQEYPQYNQQYASRVHSGSQDQNKTKVRLMSDGNVFMYNEEQRTWTLTHQQRTSNHGGRDTQHFSPHQTPQPELTIPRNAKLKLLVLHTDGKYVKSAEGSFPQNIFSGRTIFSLDTFISIGIFLNDREKEHTPHIYLGSNYGSTSFMRRLSDFKKSIQYYAYKYTPLVVEFALPALLAVCGAKYAPKAAEYFGYHALTNSTLYSLGLRVVSFVACGAGAIFLENKAVKYMSKNLDCHKNVSSILTTVANNILNRNSGEYNPDYQHTKPQHPYAKHAPTAYTALMYCGAAYVMVSNIESPIIKYLSIATATTLTAAATYLATPSEDECYSVM